MHALRNRYLFVIYVVLALLSPLPWSSHGSAETNQSTTARVVFGAEIAKAWCTECHVVGSQITGTMQVDVPTFYQIANRTGQSVERIKNFLIDPHPPMPNLHLSHEQMRNLATYILSLKRRDGN